MKNIILIGMPGAGKSTIGVLLAKVLIADFYDTDLIIQKITGKSLCDTINEIGIGAFIELEDKIISEQKFEKSVVATGGSAVYGDNAMKRLKSNGIVVYLKVSAEELIRRINNIHTRGIVMKKGTSIEELYSERAALYEKYADIILDCTGVTPEECVEKIKNSVVY